MSRQEDPTESGIGQGEVASWRELFAVPGVSPLFVAQALSTWGDYIARLSIAAVVFSWTRSPLATATTLAVSLLPTVFGRSLLSPLVDRFHFRSILVASAIARGVMVVALILAVALVVPLVLLLVLLVLLELLGAPAATAGQVMWAEMLPDRRHFVRAMSLSALSEQANQAVGLALGGLLIGLLGVRTGLLLDLVTFVVVAAVVLMTVPSRAVPSAPTGRLEVLGSLRAGLGFLRRDPVLVRLLVLSAASMLAVVAPEAVAIPYAGDHGSWGGLLMSAPIAGAAVGVVVVSRWAPRAANARILPMAMLMPLPLLFTAFHPSLPMTWLLWFVSGAFQAFMLPLQSTFTLVIPRERRGTVLGLAASVSVGVSGASYVLAGWLTEHTTPEAAVVMCAVVSLGALLLIAGTWPRRRLAAAVASAYGVGASQASVEGESTGMASGEAPVPIVATDRRDAR